MGYEEEEFTPESYQLPGVFSTHFSEGPRGYTMGPHHFKGERKFTVWVCACLWLQPPLTRSAGE